MKTNEQSSRARGYIIRYKVKLLFTLNIQCNNTDKQRLIIGDKSHIKMFLKEG